jgi:hypothetical protein
MRIGLFALVAALPLAARAEAPAPATPAAPAAASDTVDVSSVQDKLKVLTDGKGHYFALIPFGGSAFDHLYYSPDGGKTFWQQRVTGGGSAGTESFNRLLWEPRVKSRAGAELELRSGKYTQTCDTRTTELKPVAPDEEKKILSSAKFMKPRWKRRAYALARDNTGTYFYVDKQREPEDSKNFRLFSGPKGGMKLLQMTNVVSDSGGDIFATKKGELRLVLNKSETIWMQGKKQVKLMFLPIEDNAQVIYNELGVYTGEKLGTPCDDL